MELMASLVKWDFMGLNQNKPSFHLKKLIQKQNLPKNAT